MSLTAEELTRRLTYTGRNRTDLCAEINRKFGDLNGFPCTLPKLNAALNPVQPLHYRVNSQADQVSAEWVEDFKESLKDVAIQKKLMTKSKRDQYYVVLGVSDAFFVDKNLHIRYSINLLTHNFIKC